MGIVESAIRSLRNKIMTMIQRTIVTLSKPVVPGKYPTYQVEGLGNKPTEIENISPYGLASTLPIGASGIKWNIQGESSNQVGIAYDPATLPPLLAGGEVAVGAFSAGIPAFLVFTQLGTIEVWAQVLGVNTLLIRDLKTHVHLDIPGTSIFTGIPAPPPA